MGPCTFLELRVSFWHSSSCQQRKEWSRIEYLGYPGQTLFHLKAWLRARPALKFSFPGPFFVNGSPRSTALRKTKAETAGQWSSGDSHGEHTWDPFPIPSCDLTAWWPPAPVEAAGAVVQAAAPGCTDSFCFSHHCLCRRHNNREQSHI